MEITSKEALVQLFNCLIRPEVSKLSDDVTYLDLVKIVDADLNKLEQYRDLFEKICKSELSLEYSGHELKMYYDNIEHKKLI